MHRPALLCLFVLVSGCAAARTQIQILSADQAVARAKDNDADELAPYEYTLAVRYIAKAKEEAGYSNFKDALALARKAAESADRAVIDIEKKGKKVKVTGDDLEDIPTDGPAKGEIEPDKETP
jgi:hypothetical protein